MARRKMRCWGDAEADGRCTFFGDEQIGDEAPFASQSAPIDDIYADARLFIFA